MGLAMLIAVALISRSMIGTSARRQGTILRWGLSMCTGIATGTAICVGTTRDFAEFANG